MSDELKGAQYRLAKIFSPDFEYHIPSYQRPYAWTTEETSDLFSDLYDFYKNQKDEQYFLGSIVLIKDEGNPYAEVIDGQQRLTTLTILLATLAYSLADEKLKDEISEHIVEPGKDILELERKSRLTLRKRDQDFFKKYVQDLNFDELLSIDKARFKNESRKHIQANSKHLLRCIKDSFASDIDKIKDFVKFLLNRCVLVVVSTPSQQSAFRVFSVMNSRGLDLQPTDIIKADMIGKISEEYQEEYNKRWEDMEIALERDGFNDLFYFIRMIFAKEKAKKAILDEFRKHVLSKIEDPQTKIEDSQKLLEDILEPYAKALAIVKKADYKATENANDVNDYLRWLNKIDNSDWIPTAIFFMEKNLNSPDYMRWFFKKLERLAAYLHICAKNVNQRIERYNKVISALEKNNSSENPIAEIELTSEEKEEMKDALNGNIYELTPLRRNYVILRLDSFMLDGTALYDPAHSPAILTIEHVLPQTVDPNSKWAEWWPTEDERDEWRHRISNLVPLSKKRNSQAQNYDFDKKKSAYFGGSENVSPYILTTQVLDTAEWTPEFLSDQQERLLSVLSKEENWDLERG